MDEDRFKRLVEECRLSMWLVPDSPSWNPGVLGRRGHRGGKLPYQREGAWITSLAPAISLDEVLDFARALDSQDDP